MALVSMALLFTTQYRAEVEEEAPLLTVRDITELLAYYLPRRDKDEAEVHERIRIRHRKRQEDKDRRKRHKTGIPPDLTK
jgi:hypothetical protein